MWKNVIIVVLLGLLIYSNTNSIQAPSEQFGYPKLCPNGTIVLSPATCPVGTRCLNGKVVYPPNRC